MNQLLIRIIKPDIPCHTEERVNLTTTTANVPDSLRKLILSLLPDGYPNLTLVARATEMSIRTLQRRLEDSHLNYSQLIEQVRFEQAIQLLQDPSNKLIHIAFDLGYAEPASFTKAFSRWTGISPREFRRLSEWK